MTNETQLHRYKKLLAYIDQKFMEDINITEIEEVCNYSYRNINRIFEALHHETIGKYIKRVRLEKAAQYLKYSEQSISDIAYDLGFGDVAAFSKAFKKRFRCSPKAFGAGKRLMEQINKQAIDPDTEKELPSIVFEIETLPDLEILSLEYRGSYEDIKAIYKTWNLFLEYIKRKKLIKEDTVYLAEILDDNDISEEVNCRYNVAIVLDNPLPFIPEGFFSTKIIKAQKYAKFVHQGSHESALDTYHNIFSHWMTEIQLEMADAPILEFFLNDEKDTPEEDLLTEIYIPIE